MLPAAVDASNVERSQAGPGNPSTTMTNHPRVFKFSSLNCFHWPCDLLLDLTTRLLRACMARLSENERAVERLRWDPHYRYSLLSVACLTWANVLKRRRGVHIIYGALFLSCRDRSRRNENLSQLNNTPHRRAGDELVFFPWIMEDRCALNLNTHRVLQG